MTIIEKYLALTAKIQGLEDEREAMKLQVLEEIDQNAGRPIQFGKFVIKRGSRTTWKYSENIKSLATKIKELKKEEEIEGIATQETVSQFPIIVDTEKIRTPRL